MSDVIQSPYQRLGGDEEVIRLVECFYRQMSTLPEAATIRAMHADDIAPMVDKLSVFLIGWMGGPENYNKRFGRVVIPAAHEPYPIGPDERDQWLVCMQKALEEVEAEEDLVQMLMKAFYLMADMCRTDK
ncbi:MAG: globin [Deltaproteobacteria bacterium]|nr:globin [Deltaproteobacteria bacterium]